MTDFTEEQPERDRERSTGDSDKKSYEVGWGRPPSRTKWQKGRSGNPDGARKHKKATRSAARTAAEMRLELANEIVVVKINGRSVRMTLRESFMRLDAQEARKNFKVRKQLLEKWEADEKQGRLLGDGSVKRITWDEAQEQLFRELEEAAHAVDAGEEKRDPEPPSDQPDEEGHEKDDEV